MVLTNIRIDIIIKFWTCVTSLVILVIKEPVVNLSFCSKDKSTTRENTALRTSFPNELAAVEAKAADKIPPIPAIATHNNINKPVFKTTSIFSDKFNVVDKTPLSTIFSINFG